MKSLNPWGEKVNIELIKRRMTKRELAEKINTNYTQLCCVISGSRIDNSVKATVSAFLDIEN